jgi:hypothetical protein
MGSLISAAARALAAGDALRALKHIALRDDAPALPLRGIAMAQLGEWARAHELLRRAAVAFGPRARLARARCLVAEAEVALALRDFDGPSRALASAIATLDARGDRANTRHARLVAARRALLLGRLDEAAAWLGTVDAIDALGLPPLAAAVAALTAAEMALRTLRIDEAEAALARASTAARRAGVQALQAEVAQMRGALDAPAARQVRAANGPDAPNSSTGTPAGDTIALRLRDVAALLDSGALVLDVCRRSLRAGAAQLSLTRRPVLFTLAEAWPGDVGREALIARAFRMRRPDETHRARLRVELGRLRALIAPLAGVAATPHGFALRPHDGRGAAVLVPPIDGDEAALVALLADGAAWSTSALALGASQRTVQRALAELLAAGRVRALGQARARRWMAPPLAGFTTIWLLPAALPLG